jgi:hypothetical protein
MDRLIVNVLNYFGIGLATIVLIAAAWKWFLHDLFKTYLEHWTKKSEMQIQSALDNQAMIMSKQLELHAVKLGRVLPMLEEINLEISNHLMMYHNYTNAVVNKGSIGKDFEKMRYDIDSKIIDNIYRIGIYLPKEIKNILNRIRMIVSRSWKDPIVIREVLFSVFKSKDKITEVAKAAMEIYNKYLDCFQEMVESYCSVGSKSKVDCAEIMKKYGFDSDGDYIHSDVITRFAEAIFLLHEYKTNELTALVCGDYNIDEPVQ